MDWMLLPVSCFLYETYATMIAIGSLSNRMALSILLSLSLCLPCALFLPASLLSRESGISMFFPLKTLALTDHLAPTSSRPSSLLRITRDLPVFRVAASATCSHLAIMVPSTAVPAAETTCRTTLSCSNFHDTNAHEL
jgi:hypothetical protein